MYAIRSYYRAERGPEQQGRQHARQPDEHHQPGGQVVGEQGTRIGEAGRRVAAEQQGADDGQGKGDRGGRQGRPSSRPAHLRTPRSRGAIWSYNFV